MTLTRLQKIAARFCSAILVSVSVVAIAVGQDENPSSGEAAAVYSGPQVGEPAPRLQVQPLFESTEAADAGGIDWFSEPQDKPQLVVFVHETTRPGFALIRVLDAYCGELKDQFAGSAVVFLTDDVTEKRQWANVARNALPKHMQLTISSDGIEGPGTWGLNRNMTLTVVLVHQGEVKANFPIVQPSAADDGPRIVAAMAEAAGAEAPDAEKIAGWMGRGGMERDTGGVDLRPFLAPVIRRTASAEQVEEAAQKVEAEAEKNAEFKLAVGEACRRIVAADKLKEYGTEPAQAYLKKWAETFIKK
jgi:hypothetical protein